MSFLKSKKRTMFKNVILLPIFILLLSACSSNAKVVIDNPSEADINVSIDGIAYEVMAYDQMEVELKKALAQVITKDAAGKELLNEAVEITGEGVLNATKTTYVIWQDIYCTPENYELYKDKLDLKELVEVNGKEYEEVDFTLVETAFIPKAWDYNLNESFPDSVDLSNMYALKTKIYRVETLETEFGYLGDLDFGDFDDADLNAFMDSLKQVLELETEEAEL